MQQHASSCVMHYKSYSIAWLTSEFVILSYIILDMPPPLQKHVWLITFFDPGGMMYNVWYVMAWWVGQDAICNLARFFERATMWKNRCRTFVASTPFYCWSSVWPSDGRLWPSAGTPIQLFWFVCPVEKERVRMKWNSLWDLLCLPSEVLGLRDPTRSSFLPHLQGCKIGATPRGDTC